MRQQLAADGDLVRRIFGERNANRVAEAVAEERADADRALNAAIFAFAGFGDTEMDRIIPVRAELVQAGDEQSIAFNGDLWVAGLHRKNETVVVVFARDAGELERALDHAERRITVTVHDPIAQRTMIGADAHRAIEFLAKLDQRREAFLDAREFRRVLVVRVLFDEEFLGIGVVARIHADLLNPLGRFYRGFGFEMNVRYNRNVAFPPAQLRDDVL